MSVLCSRELTQGPIQRARSSWASAPQQEGLAEPQGRRVGSPSPELESGNIASWAQSRK